MSPDFCEELREAFQLKRRDFLMLIGAVGMGASLERFFPRYVRHSRGSAPRVRSRFSNSATAFCKSPGVKSGQRFSRNTNSAKAHSHNRKSESRCSPPVRISRSTSVDPPRSTSAKTLPKASLDSSVTL